MESEQLSVLVRDYLSAMTLGPTLTRALEIHTNGDLRVPALLQMLEHNPAYGHSILKQKILSRKIALWTEENPNRLDLQRFLEKRVLGLLGKTAVRNMVASFRIARTTDTGLPRKKDESIVLDPQRQIPLALKTEGFCQEHQWAFPEAGFIAGLYYDWLGAVLSLRKVPEDCKAVLSEAYEEGFWAAQHAYKLSQLMKNIHYDRHVFAASLILPIGKAWMALLYSKAKANPSWGAVMADAEKFGAGKDFASDFFEKKSFGRNHCELSALLAQVVAPFAEAAPALHWALEPWKLADSDPDQYQLAMILNTARSLARIAEVKPGESLPLQKFQSDWLKSSGVRESLLVKALGSIRGTDRGADRGAEKK